MKHKDLLMDTDFPTPTAQENIETLGVVICGGIIAILLSPLILTVIFAWIAYLLFKE